MAGETVITVVGNLVDDPELNKHINVITRQRKQEKKRCKRLV